MRGRVRPEHIGACPSHQADWSGRTGCAWLRTGRMPATSGRARLCWAICTPTTPSSCPKCCRASPLGLPLWRRACRCYRAFPDSCKQSSGALKASQAHDFCTACAVHFSQPRWHGGRVSQGYACDCYSCMPAFMSASTNSQRCARCQPCGTDHPAKRAAAHMCSITSIQAQNQIQIHKSSSANRCWLCI